MQLSEEIEEDLDDDIEDMNSLNDLEDSSKKVKEEVNLHRVSEKFEGDEEGSTPLKPNKGRREAVGRGKGNNRKRRPEEEEYEEERVDKQKKRIISGRTRSKVRV